MKRLPVLLLIVILVGLIYSQMRLSYGLNLLTAKTSIQIGMTEKQATQIMEHTPRVIRKGEKLNPKLTFPENVRVPNDRVLLYSKLIPSCYVVVHLNPRGVIDGILFLES